MGYFGSVQIFKIPVRRFRFMEEVYKHGGALDSRVAALPSIWSYLRFELVAADIFHNVGAYFMSRVTEEDQAIGMPDIKDNFFEGHHGALGPHPP